jgi:hypothetical protein
MSKDRLKPSLTAEHDFLDKINSVNKAHFLGFFAGDGYNLKTGFGIKLNKKDKSFLIALKNLIDKKSPIKKHKIYHGRLSTSGEACSFIIRSKKICDKLTSLGMPPRKTNVLSLPKLKQELYRHYLRGLFEADGCICISGSQKNLKYRRSFSFDITCKNEKYANEIIKTFYLCCGLILHKRKTTSVFRVYANGYNSIKTLHKLFYKNLPQDSIILNRKYQKFKQAIKLIEKYENNPR